MSALPTSHILAPVQERLETHIPDGLKYVLLADLVCMIYSAATCYGRSQASWKRMNSSEVGLIVQWQGHMFRGVSSVMLLPMLVRILFEDLMTYENVGQLAFAEALWISVYIGTAGPGLICWLGLLINPHSWLAIGFVATGRQWISWQYLLGITFAFLQCLYTRSAMKRAVFGNPEEFTCERYYQALSVALAPRRAVEPGTLMVNTLSIRLFGWLSGMEAAATTTRQLTVEVMAAHNLPRRKGTCQPCSDLPNPFLKIILGDTEHVSKARPGCLSPMWSAEDDNVFKVKVHPMEEVIGMEKLRLEVWDRGLLMPHELLGMIDLPLSSLLPLLDGTRGCCCIFRATLKDCEKGELSFKADLQRVADEASSKQGVFDFLRRYIFYIVMLGMVVQFVTLSCFDHRIADRLPPLDQCLEDTGVPCYYLIGSCEDFRNTTCVYSSPFGFKGRCLCDTRVSCAYGGVCLNRPSLLTYTAPAPEPKLPRKALVLSGGGAKGAYELGVLQGICANKSRVDLRDWTMILGTSIGALNAGFLAQFSPSMQCSEAVPALAKYWQNIVDSRAVWQSPTQMKVEQNARPNCFNVAEASAMLWYFGPTGGLCDPRPGAERYEFEVRPEHIKASGMQLRVLATSLETGGARWWTENDPSVVQGAEASGSIAPLVWPKEVDGEWFIDGGFLANTPLLRALQEGVRDVLVIILSPLATPSLHNITKLRKAGNFGEEVLAFEYGLLVYRYFVGFELSTACRNFTEARIRGYMPQGSIGSVLDFDREHIEIARRLGLQATDEEPIDLCSNFRSSPTQQPHPSAPHPAAHPAATNLAASLAPLPLERVDAAVAADTSVGGREAADAGAWPQQAAVGGAGTGAASIELLDMAADASPLALWALVAISMGAGAGAAACGAWRRGRRQSAEALDPVLAPLTQPLAHP
uniref:PNPLA domain-containing protein n=1 Tax=Alexandrium monilatum TaxID=311494 RepID=A0A7S4RWZ9_9DINO|mmetsp:Transcript_36093/g.112220  ORF Transcript_36093/g.112220 Transcript_36093/m.112220 type:complete len:924 (-) Transcript_36093:43-2814(-)